VVRLIRSLCASPKGGRMDELSSSLSIVWACMGRRIGVGMRSRSVPCGWCGNKVVA
jgi:hypothetical protein